MKTKFGALPFVLLLATFNISAQTVDAGVTESEIRIGQFAALTGPAAELGKRMQMGIQAHFTAINAAGGIKDANSRWYREMTVTSRIKPPQRSRR